MIVDGCSANVQPCGDAGWGNALREQAAASTEIAQNVERIARMAEENSAAAASNSDTATQLDELSGALKDSVTHFKV